jgi:hypothetical protein
MTTLNQVKVVNRKIEGRDLSQDSAKLNPAHLPVDSTAFSNLGGSSPTNLEELLQLLVDQKGEKGDQGQQGLDGLKGDSLQSVSYDHNTGWLTITGDTPDLSTSAMIKGADGVGVSYTGYNPIDFEFTLHFTDGNSYSFPIPKGDQGEKGEMGTWITGASHDGDDLLIHFSEPVFKATIPTAGWAHLENGNDTVGYLTYRMPNLQGIQGDVGPQGDRGIKGLGLVDMQLDAATGEVLMVYEDFGAHETGVQVTDTNPADATTGTVTFNFSPFADCSFAPEMDQHLLNLLQIERVADNTDPNTPAYQVVYNFNPANPVPP